MIPFAVKVQFDAQVMAKMATMVAGMSDGSAFDSMLSVTQEVMAHMREVAVGASPRGDRPKSSPRLKDSWSQAETQGNKVLFGNSRPYAFVLEYGHYEGVGPRTVAGTYGGESRHSGIFSRQAPQGMLGIMEANGSLDAAVSTILDESIKLMQRFR